MDSISLEFTRPKSKLRLLGAVALSLAILFRLGVSISVSVESSDLFVVQPPTLLDIANDTAYHEPRTWNLNTLPNPTDTGNLIFNVASSLLQNWPNVRYRNGHTLIPGTIPPNTLLYHGRSTPDLPFLSPSNASPNTTTTTTTTKADWTSLDPEHSHLFCRLGPQCYHLTLVTTRPLRIFYFDGSSAAKMRGGPLDVQDLLLWGGERGDKAFSEEERLEGLCRMYGGEGGVDGFVRMEMAFEVMLCDMSPTGGVQTVSFVRLYTGSNSNSNSTSRERDPEEIRMRNFELVHSASQHNAYPGDTRVKLDFSRMVTVHDPAFSLGQGQGRERWTHRAAHAGVDVEAFRRRVEEVLHWRDGEEGSGIDWSTLMNVIIKRYGTRLEMLRYILDHVDDSTTFEKAFTQIEVMLMPYLLADAIPVFPSSTATPLDLERIYEMCSTAHTSYIPTLSPTLTKSELLLLSAIRTTTKEICRVLVNAWGVGFLSLTTDEDKHEHKERILETWRNDITGVMDWLDWSVWVKCRPGCSDEELCYLPTWPFFRAPPPADTYIPDELKPTPEEEEVWKRPKPRCIRKIAPYEV